jgi:hypothetical protein
MEAWRLPSLFQYPSLGGSKVKDIGISEAQAMSAADALRLPVGAEIGYVVTHTGTMQTWRHAVVEYVTAEYIVIAGGDDLLIGSDDVCHWPAQCACGDYCTSGECVDIVYTRPARKGVPNVGVRHHA